MLFAAEKPWRLSPTTIPQRHNVVEKLEKKNAAFLTAFLGSLANKEKFLDAQTGAYPNMSDWEMPPEERQQLDQETTALSKELNEMLNAKKPHCGKSSRSSCS